MVVVFVATTGAGWLRMVLMRLTYLSIADHAELPANDEVHLWSATLDIQVDDSMLTEEERARAARFKMERVRNQFIAARTHLRTILSGYLNTTPLEVRIISESSGKPYLDPCHADGLQFNVTHSENIAIYAIATCGRVGVDVEHCRPIPNAESLVERFFTQRERDQFKSLTETERHDAFFRAWTRKEAVLKAIGRGVQSLDECDVTFGADEPEQVLRLGMDHDVAAKWFLRSWQPQQEYAAAVAVEMRS